MRIKSMLVPLALSLFLLVVSPLASQDGLGVIREGHPGGTSPSFHPLRCDTPACQHIIDLLFPRLLAVDPLEGHFIPSTGSDSALASGWDISEDGLTYTFTLRNDLTWSDGTPVTAYDVFFTLLDQYIGYDKNAKSLFSDPAVRAIIPQDEHTLVVKFAAAACNQLHTLDTSIIPFHAYEPDFAAQSRAIFATNGEPQAHFETRFETWMEEASRNYRTIIDSHTPTVTAGLYEIAEIRPTESLRLLNQNGAQGYIHLNMPDADTIVDRFLMGDLNLLANPPADRLADIRHAEGIQYAEYPGQIWDYILLNLADPAEPRSAFDEDGNPLDQGYHPILSDVHVRYALQLATDVQALIDSAAYGSATIMPANQRPGTWAYDTTLSPVPYDPLQARAILDTAGWRDWNGDGIRECHGCQYATEGRSLSLSLDYNFDSNRRAITANLIRQQWREVGVDVFPNGLDFATQRNILRSQRFDASLLGRMDSYPHDPDQTMQFTIMGDILGAGSNYGSYHNPEVDALMSEALTMPNCDSDQRAANYHQIQRLLHQDQPYIWLFTVNDFAAASGGVRGFDPQSGAPYWNIHNWIIQE